MPLPRLQQVLTRVLTSHPQHRLRRARRSHQLCCEPLEDRRLLSVSYPNFLSTDGLNLVDEAGAAVDSAFRPVLRLTPAEQGRQGGAWFEQQQSVAFDVETTFEFRMSDGSDGGDGTDGSDGFAFVIQNNGVDSLGGGGGAIGYAGIFNSLAVEFDTWQNIEAGDPSRSHISVQTNGIDENGPGENYSLGSFDTLGQLGYPLDDAQVHTATIRYVLGKMDIFLDGAAQPVLTIAVDLATTLDLDHGRAWVGFTAATGGGWQNHDILNWQYTSLVDVTPVVTIGRADAVEGSSGLTVREVPIRVTRPDTDGELSVHVDYATADGTAVAGSDYTPSNGTLTFDLADGQAEMTQTVTILVNGDTDEEDHEEFFVLLSDPVGAATIGAPIPIRILNDDTSISIDDASVVEGDTTFRSLGAFVPTGSGGLISPYSAAFGPDGYLYVSGRDGDNVLRYDPVTGAFHDEFVAAGSGGLDRPKGLAFDQDGNLYVGSPRTDAVLRYDSNGAPLPGPNGTPGTAEFVPPGKGGLDAPVALAFDADWNLYVSSHSPSSILRYDPTGNPLPGPRGTTGTAEFVAAGSGGLQSPRTLAFRDDGRLYVASMSTDSILRFDANSGAFIDDFVSSGSGGLDNPHGFAFDAAGNLYVGSSGGDNSVLRYAAATGALIDQIVPSGEDGLNGPRELLFDAVGNLYVVDMRADNVLRYGAASQAVFTVSLSKPSALPVSVDFTTADGTAAAGIDFATTSGTLVFEPGVTSRTIAVPTVDDTVAEPEETFFVNLSDPSGGAAIADDHAVATIVDDNDAIVLGDLNGDGKVNGLDADLFVAALLDNTDDVAADMNQDGVVNGLDVDWFVAAVVRKPLPGDVNVDARVNLGGSSRPVAHHN